MYFQNISKCISGARSWVMEGRKVSKKWNKVLKKENFESVFWRLYQPFIISRYVWVIDCYKCLGNPTTRYPIPCHGAWVEHSPSASSRCSAACSSNHPEAGCQTTWVVRDCQPFWTSVAQQAAAVEPRPQDKGSAFPGDFLESPLQERGWRICHLPWWLWRNGCNQAGLWARISRQYVCIC